MSAAYRIRPKRDFGSRPFLINGRMVDTGFVVTFASGPWKGCNAMPGGTWSQDIRGALRMIRVLDRVGVRPDGGCVDSDRFWRILYRVNGVTQRSRDETARIMKGMVMRKGAWIEMHVLATSRSA